MAPDILTIRVVVTNRKALKALRVIADALGESADVMEWRPELKRAARAAKYLFDHLHVERVK